MTSVFVGFSGPVGYDYWRGSDRSNHRTPPNAVLEDVTGLLLCYDKLYFLSRDFCPEDMWELPYVEFVSEDAVLHARAVTAYEQMSELISEHGSLGWGDISGTFTRTIGAMTKGTGGGIDNHSHALAHTDGFGRTGNSAHADSVIIDVGISAALEMNELDVLTNSVANEVVQQRVVDVDVERRFTDWHVDVATELAAIKVPNRLGPQGSYHEDLEELRSHPQIKSFREHLRATPSGNVLPSEQALELSELADAYARRSLQREHHSRPIYETLGRSALGPAGNLALPMLGTVANGALKAVEVVQEKRRLRSTAWAAFVVALKN